MILLFTHDRQSRSDHSSHSRRFLETLLSSGLMANGRVRVNAIIANRGFCRLDMEALF